MVDVKQLPTEELRLRAIHLRGLIAKCRDPKHKEEPFAELTRVQEEINRRFVKHLVHKKMKKPTTIFIGGKR